MSLPEILYPNSIDNNDNLYLVHDSLRLRLTEDYHPGDTFISVETVPSLSIWPAKGLITLTEQCSEIDDRAISFFYDGVDATNGIINNLQLLPGFNDVIKSKIVTNVTQNVQADHHNKLKDALIAIETFIGVKGNIDSKPFGDTLEGRVNFLRRLALTPKAWFTSDKRTGVVPLEIELNDLSFRLGTDGTAGPVVITWDFGDNSTSTVSLISTISETSIVPSDVDNIYVYDTDGGKIKKTYLKPGIYDVTMTVKNDFGEDSITFPNYINARLKAPNEAVIRYVEAVGQNVTVGSPAGGPYDVNPKIRSPINTLVTFDILQGENPSTPDYSYSGELLNSNGQPIDAITNYTWSLGDDLSHPNSSTTKASYGVGGIYDLILRVDTEFGAYRITNYENTIDIVENANLWMWLFENTNDVRSYEYGLISETFKLNSNTPLTLNRNSDFLNDVPDSEKQIQEFKRNVGFAPRSSQFSGQGGTALLYYASGRNEFDAISVETINFVEYSGFNDTYITRDSVTRPWNWASFTSGIFSFFMFGTNTSNPLPNTSPTNPIKTSLDLNSLATTNVTLTTSDFQNNGQELLNNSALYDSNGNNIYGNYSVYRTAWKDSTGYLARNDAVGPFFRIKSFYRTEGSVSNPFITMRKMTDIQGTTKHEGDLTNLSLGIYLFNNSGAVSQFSDTGSVWKTTGSGVNSVGYRALQDTSVEGFDEETNTLLIASDSDTRAYISFDYSPNAFIKFNEIDTTFKSLGSRPFGDQWILGIY